MAVGKDADCPRTGPLKVEGVSNEHVKVAPTAVHKKPEVKLCTIKQPQTSAVYFIALPCFEFTVSLSRFILAPIYRWDVRRSAHFLTTLMTAF